MAALDSDTTFQYDHLSMKFEKWYYLKFPKAIKYWIYLGALLHCHNLTIFYDIIYINSNLNPL